MGGPWPLRPRRSEVLIDPLTGMLNRSALRQRVSELAQQSAIARQPIGLIVGDVDLLAGVNDSAGRPLGDDVLRDVASVLRRTLRAFDLAYRTSGDRFLVLLPGADLDNASNLAEILRAAVETERHGGQRLTMSFGAAASKADGDFDYDAVLAAAERALRLAKDSGRNRVWPPPPGGAVLAA
jgi:diguanylate cyclase (GGDEF)-like protein